MGVQVRKLSPALADWTTSRRTERRIQTQRAQMKLHTLDKEIKPVGKKFAEMKIGEQFTALGERYVKSGPLNYRSLDNPSMGEYPAGPILDQQIDKEPQLIKTKLTVTKDPEVDEVERAIAQGQSTPISKKGLNKENASSLCGSKKVKKSKTKKAK